MKHQLIKPITFGTVMTLMCFSGYNIASAQTTLQNPKTEFSDTINERAEELEEIVSEGKKRKRKNLKFPLFKKTLKDRNNTLATGERHFADGDFTRARKSYELILSRYSKDAYVNYRMGLTMYRMESYEEARPYFETALRVDPNIYDAYTTLTASYILEGNLNEAKAVHERLKAWRKQCGLMCVADGSAFKAEYEIEGMLKWAKTKNEIN